MPPWTRRLPLRLTTRLIVYLALSGILPPLVVGIASYNVSRNIVRDEMQRHSLQLLRAQRDYLESRVDQVEGLIGNVLGVEAISDVIAHPGGDLETYQQLATQARIGYLLNGYMDLRGLVSIDIFAAGGRHYHVGDTLDVRGTAETERNAMLAAASADPDTTAWAGLETNVNGKSRYRQVVATARAINTFDGPNQERRTIGFLLISQDVDFFYTAFHRLEVGMPGLLLLIDGKHRLIYSRDSSLIGTLPDPSIVAALADNRRTLQLNIGGTEVLMTKVISPTTGWWLVSLVPLEELDARSLPIWHTTAIAILACLVVIAMAALSFSQSVVSPLRRIRHGF